MSTSKTNTLFDGKLEYSTWYQIEDKQKYKEIKDKTMNMWEKRWRIEKNETSLTNTIIKSVNELVNKKHGDNDFYITQLVTGRTLILWNMFENNQKGINRKLMLPQNEK